MLYEFIFEPTPRLWQHTRKVAPCGYHWLTATAKAMHLVAAQPRKTARGRLGLPEFPQHHMRAGTNFASGFNADSPVQSSGEKYWYFVFQKNMIVWRRPVLIRRDGRVVTNVERGMRWT